MTARFAQTFSAGFLCAAIALSCTMAQDVAALSRTSSVIDGKRITVIGGSAQSIRSNGRETLIMLDGRGVVVSRGRIVVDGALHNVGNFSTLEIRVEGDALKVLVDDRPLD